jgi:hypothetical protein
VYSKQDAKEILDILKAIDLRGAPKDSNREAKAYYIDKNNNVLNKLEEVLTSLRLYRNPSPTNKVGKNKEIHKKGNKELD